MRENTPQDNTMMLAALGILAYAASMMTHEALGHGGFCLAVGGRNAMLTAWGERCTFPMVHARGIEAAGPATQWGAGMLAWLLLRVLSPDAATLRYFVGLYRVFHLFFSGKTNFGDAAVLVAGLRSTHRVAWRTCPARCSGLFSVHAAGRVGAQAIRRP